jgi:hypothetical protein
MIGGIVERSSTQLLPGTGDSEGDVLLFRIPQELGRFVREVGD